MRNLAGLALRPGLSFRELLTQMHSTSFGARSLGHAWHVLRRIIHDPDCRVVLTLSGAMSVAQCGSIFLDMVQKGLVHAVVSTGAVVTHQFCRELGGRHYAVPSGVTDEELADQRLNRVYDSVEPEANLEDLDRFIEAAMRGQHGRMCSEDVVSCLASQLADQSGWLATSVKFGVSVFIPALTDSELGLCIFKQAARKESEWSYDSLLDLERFASWIVSSRRIAVIMLGGGVPRNWAMQMVPFLRSTGQSALPRVVAGIRICPDSAVYGHLSGSTFSEAITWGKLEASDLANFAEVVCDATIAFPLLIQAAIEEKESGGGGHTEW